MCVCCVLCVCVCVWCVCVRCVCAVCVVCVCAVCVCGVCGVCVCSVCVCVCRRGLTVLVQPDVLRSCCKLVQASCIQHVQHLMYY